MSVFGDKLDCLADEIEIDIIKREMETDANPAGFYAVVATDDLFSVFTRKLVTDVEKKVAVRPGT